MRKSANEFVGTEREGRALRGDGGAGGDWADHVFDGADPGDGFFGEGEAKGHGAHQFAIDINGTAAHSLHHPGLLERAAGEPRENDGLARPHVVEHAEDFHLELFDAISGKNGASGAVHTGPDIL